MNTLYVAWQQPDSKEWIPVGRLDRSDNKFRFMYTRGVHRARDFQPFSRMDQVNSVYESESLFPLFSNRLIGKSRPEFKDYLRWMGMSDSPDDPMSILALTGGIRGTDSIELFQPSSIDNDGNYHLDFFARSLSFLPKETLAMISELNPGTPLLLMRDQQNSFDGFALALRSENPTFMVGYCPKYFVKQLSALLDDSQSNLRVVVKSVNVDAPLNMRLLCSVTARPTFNFPFFDKEIDFQPIADSVPNGWTWINAELEQTLSDAG